MKQRARFMKVGVLALAAVLLAGCANRHRHAEHGMGPLNALQQGLLRQDRDRNGVLDQNQKVMDVKICSTGVCVIDVAVAATVPPAPGAPFDCGISLKDPAKVGKNADVVLLNSKATQITWNLVPAANTKIEFRFKKQSSPATAGNGITLYADPQQRAFQISVPKPAQVDAIRVARRIDMAYAYGIYVEWRASEKESFSDCTPYDPIIIEHD